MFDDLTGDKGSSQHVQIAVHFGKAEAGGKNLSHRAVAVEDCYFTATLLERGLQGFRGCCLAGRRQAGEPHAKAMGAAVSLKIVQVCSCHYSTPCETLI